MPDTCSRVCRDAADVTEENIQSRARGLLLMAMSNKFARWCFDRQQERIGRRYCTLYGDMVVDWRSSRMCLRRWSTG